MDNYYYLSFPKESEYNNENIDSKLFENESSKIFSPINPNINIKLIKLTAYNNKNNIIFDNNNILKLNEEAQNISPEQNNFDSPQLTKKTLILDLDETLVHSSMNPFPDKVNIIMDINVEGKNYTIYAIVRPFVDEFLYEMSQYYDIIIFTASIGEYSNPLLQMIDKNKVVKEILNREYCQFSEGFYIKNLSIIKRNIKDLIIVDNNPISYIFNKENGIPILTWIDNPNDCELIKLMPILRFLSKVNDVRPFINLIVKKNDGQLDFNKIEKLLNNSNIKKNNLIDIQNVRLNYISKINLNESNNNNYVDKIHLSNKKNKFKKKVINININDKINNKLNEEFSNLNLNDENSNITKMDSNTFSKIYEINNFHKNASNYNPSSVNRYFNLKDNFSSIKNKYLIPNRNNTFKKAIANNDLTKKTYNNLYNNINNINKNNNFIKINENNYDDINFWDINEESLFIKKKNKDNFNNIHSKQLTNQIPKIKNKISYHHQHSDSFKNSINEINKDRKNTYNNTIDENNDIYLKKEKENYSNSIDNNNIFTPLKVKKIKNKFTKINKENINTKSNILFNNTRKNKIKINLNDKRYPNEKRNKKKIVVMKIIKDNSNNSFSKSSIFKMNSSYLDKLDNIPKRFINLEATLKNSENSYVNRNLPKFNTSQFENNNYEKDYNQFRNRQNKNEKIYLNNYKFNHRTFTRREVPNLLRNMNNIENYEYKTNKNLFHFNTKNNSLIQ